MKHFLITAIALVLAFTGFTQNEKYTKAMEAQLAIMDSVQSANGLADLANAFERIGDAEKNQWLPYYYAALCHLRVGYAQFQGQAGAAEKVDPEADKAETLLNKAEALSKDNSEIYCLRKMMNTLKMTVDPQNRYMTYGPAAAEALNRAKQLDPENPRVYMLEGQDKFYTPEQFGGSKPEAKILFEEAMKKFAAFHPTSSIHPKWGLVQTQYLHAQCN